MIIGARNIIGILCLVLSLFFCPDSGMSQSLSGISTPQNKQVESSVWKKISQVLEKGVSEDVDFFQDPTQEDREYLRKFLDILEKDPQEAKKLLKARAETGNANFQHIMSVFLTAESKIGILKGDDYSQEETIYWSKEAALHGHYRAQFLLGFLYGRAQDGKVRPNYEEAKKWYEMAAQNSHNIKGEPEYQLALLYEAGLLKPESKAIEYYLLAAEKGDKKAQTEVGYFYENGQYVEKDHDKAVFWIQKAADQGVSLAQLNMAKFYQEGSIGNGSPNYPKFIEWATKAADQGEGMALYQLGIFYFKGNPDYPVDHNKAIDYFRRGALKSHGPSQYMFGAMNEKGVGTAANKVQAYLYYNLAYQNGFVQARTHSKALRQNMTDAEIAQAESLLDALEAVKNPGK